MNNQDLANYYNNGLIAIQEYCRIAAQRYWSIYVPDIHWLTTATSQYAALRPKKERKKK